MVSSKLILFFVLFIAVSANNPNIDKALVSFLYYCFMSDIVLGIFFFPGALGDFPLITWTLRSIVMWPFVI